MCHDPVIMSAAIYHFSLALSVTYVSHSRRVLCLSNAACTNLVKDLVGYLLADVTCESERAGDVAWPGYGVMLSAAVRFDVIVFLCTRSFVVWNNGFAGQSPKCQPSTDPG